MAEKFYTLNTDQLNALHMLLSLVHYDDLANACLNMLPFDFNPSVIPHIFPDYDTFMAAPVMDPINPN